MKTKSNIAILYFVYYFALGCIIPFNTIYMQNYLNFSGEQIGTIWAFSLIASSFFSPIQGMIADRINNPKRIIIISLILASILFVPYIYSNTYFMILMVFIFACGIRSGIGNLLDAITIDYTFKQQLNYGSFRAIGSLSFIFGSIFMGILASYLNTIPSLFVVVHIIFLIITLLFMFPLQSEYTISNRSNFKGDIKVLLKNKEYIFLTITLAIAISMIQNTQSYVAIAIDDLGGSSSIIGISTFFMVIPEVIFIPIVLKLTNKIKHEYLILTGILALLLRWIVLYYTNSLVILLLFSSIHGIVFALVYVVGLDLMRRCINPSMISTAISIYAALMGIVFAISSYFTGVALEIGGIKLTYVFNIIVVLILLFIFSFTLLFNKKEESYV